MTTIDEATGLPALPEGMFWRIDEHCVHIMRRGEWSEWSDTKRFGGYWCDYDERKTVKSKGVIFIRKEEVTEYRFRELDSVHLVKFGTRDEYGALIEEDPVTPENVVERCQEVLAAYNEKVEREALYGDYPPKKFDLESIAQEDTNEA